MLRCISLPVSLVVLFTSLASSQAQVVVRKAGAEKTSLDMSGFSQPTTEEGRLFLQTLERNLRLSGWFEFAPRGRGEFRMLGEASSSGGSLQVRCQVFSTADQHSVISRTYRGTRDNPRALAHQIADDIVERITGHPGVARTKIALVGTASGHKELYLMDADGGGLRQLTRDRSIAMFPKWLPDASGLIYVSFMQRFPDLYRIRLRTGERERISQYSNLNAGGAVSPDGRYAAVILSGRDVTTQNPMLNNPELCIRDLRSGRVTRLTRTPHATESSPSWSPDGRQIVYVSDQAGRPHLYIISREGGEPRRLTSRGTQNTSPDWGSNGLIAYTTRQGGRSIIQIINPETGEITTPPQDAADYDEASWAPNGRHIVATRTQNHRARIYLLDSMGDPPVSLLADTKGDWYAPAWSPTQL